MSSFEGVKRGAFIVFEGVDRCGKSTQVDLLGKSLTNAQNIRFPNRTSNIGQLINSYLSSATNMSDQAIHLLFSANRWEATEDMRKQLESGVTLICDRYAHSGVAFSSAKGLDMDWCVNCDRGLIAPDAIIYLDLSIEDAMKRGDFGLERYEKKDFQEQVRAKFTALQGVEAGHCMQWFTVDARKSKEELQAEIRGIAEAVVQRVQHTPIHTLWTKTK